MELCALRGQQKQVGQSLICLKFYVHVHVHCKSFRAILAYTVLYEPMSKLAWWTCVRLVSVPVLSSKISLFDLCLYGEHCTKNFQFEGTWLYKTGVCYMC